MIKYVALKIRNTTGHLDDTTSRDVIESPRDVITTPHDITPHDITNNHLSSSKFAGTNKLVQEPLSGDRVERSQISGRFVYTGFHGYPRFCIVTKVTTVTVQLQSTVTFQYSYRGYNGYWD